jgi:hypothetical protein
MNGSIWRAERLALTGLLAVTLLLMALYARVIPPLEGFDADAHYLAALYLRENGRLPPLEREIIPISYELISQPLLYHGLVALAIWPWPVQPTRELTEALVNPYFDKSMSLRQMLVLPAGDPINQPLAALPIRIASLVSMLGGLLAVYGTWRLGRALVPAQWSFALATAAIVGFNPIFLFLSVVVTNDAWAVATIVFCVALAAEAALGHAPARRSARRWFWAGVWGGLATLTKYSGFMAGLPAALLWLCYLRRQGWTAAGKGLLWALAGGVLVAGWWFARMAWLYGEVIPMQRISAIFGGLNRVPPLSWAETFEFAPWLLWSYWGVFVAVIAPATFFTVVSWLMIGGLAGLLPALIRRDDASYAAKGWTLALALLWTAASAAAVLYWTRTINYGEQGRLAHIGAPALALLLVIGWQSFAPVRWRPLIHGALVALMVVLALWLLPTLQRGFGLPSSTANPAPSRQMTATFGNGPMLVGADLPNGAWVAPGEAMPLILYWTTETLIADHFTLFVHLADANNRLLYQFDGVADQGRHPTRQWRIGEMFADTHLITIPADVTPGLATLSVGFYPLDDTNRRLEVKDDAGNVTGDRLVLGQVYVADEAITPSPPPAEAVASWVNGITLAESIIVQEDGDPIGLNLKWWSAATLHQDYTLFAQVLDGENHILAQIDLRGERPTSTWRMGDQVPMQVRWRATTGTALAQWQQVIVGWYDAGGVRLPLSDGGDFIVVARREAP